VKLRRHPVVTLLCIAAALLLQIFAAIFMKRRTS
jgi:hypothetical protein